MVASSGLTQLSYRAQDLVASAPWSLGQSGKSMMVGAKTSYLAEVDLLSGNILQTLTTTSDSCPASPPSSSTVGLTQPSVWLGRNDFVVRAFDTSARQLLWNLTYSEVVPPALPSDAPGALVPADRGARARLASCSARQVDDVFSATVHGEVEACDAVTGDTLWFSESIGAPLAHMYDVCYTATGETSYIEHRLREVWPASLEFQQQLLAPAEQPASGAGFGIDASSSSFASSKGSSLTDLARRSEVFVGGLPGGQLYALPRSPHTTFDFSPPLEAFGADGSALLPAPSRDAAPSGPGSRDVVVVHAEDGVVSDGPITARWLEQCGALWDLTRDPLVEYQCLIGVHNVSAAVDSHALRALPAVVPPALAQSAGIDALSRGSSASSASPSLLSALSLQLARWIVPAALVIHAASAIELLFGTSVAVAFLLIVVAVLARLPVCRRAAQRGANALLGEWRRPGRAHRRGRGGRGAVASEASGSQATVAGTTESVADGAVVAASADEAASASTSSGPALARLHGSESTVLLGGIVHRIIGRLAISDRVLGYGCNGTVVYAGQVRRDDSGPVESVWL
jgi:hypothetical protein